MTIFMKVYLTLLVVSFFTMFIGLLLLNDNETLGWILALPFPILLLGGLLYSMLCAIWGV